jgi:hypothetical protein
VDRRTFGVARIDSAESNVAETAAVRAALHYSSGPVTIHTDSEVLAVALGDPSSFTYKRMVVADPTIPELSRELDRRHSTVSFTHGHGLDVPLELRFVDILSRATARRFASIDLVIGEEVLSEGTIRVAGSSRIPLPDCPEDQALDAHFHAHILPLLGRRHRKSMSRLLEQEYQAQLPARLPLKKRRRVVKRAALALQD